MQDEEGGEDGEEGGVEEAEVAEALGQDEAKIDDTEDTGAAPAGCRAPLLVSAGSGVARVAPASCGPAAAM